MKLSHEITDTTLFLSASPRLRALSAPRLLIACCLALVMGCAAAKTLPVNGRVEFEDKSDVSALEGYIVSFESVEQKVGGEGIVQKDGTFKISTFGDYDGAVPGKHKVAINPPQPEPDTVPPKPVIDKIYFDPATTPIEKDVTKGNPDITITVKRLPGA